MKGAKILLAIQLDKLKILRKNLTGMMKKHLWSVSSDKNTYCKSLWIKAYANRPECECKGCC